MESAYLQIEIALLARETKQLSGLTPTPGEEAAHVSEASKARRLRIQNGSRRRVSEEVVRNRAIDTRSVLTQNTGPERTPFAKARLAVKELQDPDLAAKKVLITASADRRESHILIISPAALRSWPPLQVDNAVAFSKSDGFDRYVFVIARSIAGDSQFWELWSAVYGSNDAPFLFCQTLRNYQQERNLWLQLGQVFCAPSDFDDNLVLIFANDQSGSVGLLSTRAADILVCCEPSICPVVSRLLPLRLGVLKPRAFEVTRFNNESELLEWTPLPISHSARSLWKRRAKSRELSWADGFRPLLGRLSWVAAGSRPDISASLGELSEKVNCLTKVDLFTINQLVSFLQEPMDGRKLNTLRKLNPLASSRASLPTARWAQ